MVGWLGVTTDTGAGGSLENTAIGVTGAASLVFMGAGQGEG